MEGRGWIETNGLVGLSPSLSSAVLGQKGEEMRKKLFPLSCFFPWVEHGKMTGEKSSDVTD